jgi:hypothetical protein
MRVNEMVARHGRYDRQRFHAAKTKVELQKDLANSDFVIRTDWSSVTGWNQETWRTLPNLWPFVDYVVMADSGRIVDEVPAPLRGTHAKCVTMILLSLLQYGKKEDEEPLKAWALYFLYVTMCLQKDVVKGAKPDRLSWQQETVRRMQMFLNGRWEELLVETLGRIRRIRHAREEAELKAPSQPPIDQKRKINAAAFWTNMKKGRTKAAYDEIVGKPTIHHNLSEEAKKVIEEKLPKQDLPNPDLFERVREIAREAKNQVAFEVDTVRRYYAGHAKKAGGLSRLCFRHFNDAAKVQLARNTPSFWMRLKTVLEIIANGNIPDAILPFITGGRGGIQGQKRLFVSGEVVQRSADALTCIVWLRSGGRLKHNLGVGVSGAIDVFRHWVKAQRRKHKKYDDWVVIEVDARNMFHKIDREQLIRQVAEEAPIMLNSVLKLTSHQNISMFNGTYFTECTTGTIIGGGNSSTPASMMMDVCVGQLLQTAGQQEVH